jgi:hypothetical protein
VKHWLSIVRFVALVLSLTAGTAGMAGCKQGLGDRCEVDADCSSGTCSQAVPKVCVSRQGDNTQIDATLPIDAAIDAPVPVDAPRE